MGSMRKCYGIIARTTPSNSQLDTLAEEGNVRFKL